MEKCDELGYMCVGFVSDGLGTYRLREVTQLISDDSADSECNVGGDHVYHKKCPGDVSFVQVAPEIINGRIRNRVKIFHETYEFCHKRMNRKYKIYFFNPQAVGLDLGVPFSLRNFSRTHVKTNNFKNVTNLIFHSALNHKYKSSS